jgi:HPt (histidine-containing phosphotransfer) domain-containing protein
MIDKQKALDIFHITLEEYDEMLVEFVTQADEKITEIEKLIKEGKGVDAERQTHSLKGVSGNLRLDDCYLAASQIDAALKNEQSISSNPDLTDLKRAIDEIRASVRL